MAYTGYLRPGLNVGYLRGAYVMDDFNRIKHAQLDTNKPCHCSQIPTMVHELSQSILVIHAYVCGCSERLKNSALDDDHLAVVLKKINHHLELISNKINLIL